MSEAGQDEHEEGLIKQARQEARELAVAASSASAATGSLLGGVVPPPAIRGYETVRQLARGGQGVVYQAIQKTTRRKVAIKVMREGPFADAREIARFDREVQILGQLNHPNIVTVHDAGEAAGHFYYVMDYVPGVTLGEYIAGGERPVAESLRLFVKICDAVNAAHLQGIIHRDLKPGNIRVDLNGEPRILDFGLAKVAIGGLVGQSEPQPMTFSGQFIGSLPWASPEQAAAKPDRIDMRTDVYSLGVVLYQMLTGTFPYPVRGDMLDVRNNILKTEPVHPSSVRRQINNEVETIVLKCLDKEPERRYQTAGELGRDLKRYLAGEPIEAKRDSAWYVLRKLARRHRLRAAVAAGYGLLITASAVALLFMFQHAQGQQRLAAEYHDLVDAVGTFNRGAEAVMDPFSRAAFDADLLDRVAGWVETEAANRPEREAAYRTTLGLGYLKLRFYKEAEWHLSRAVAAREGRRWDPLDLAHSYHNLGRALFWNSKYPEAQDRYRQALGIYERQLRAPHLDIANSRNDLAACLLKRGRFREATSLFQAALATRRQLLDDADPWIAASVNNLGVSLRAEGRYREAREYFEEALDRISGQEINELFVVRGLRNIASCQLALGDYPSAQATLAEARHRSETLPGDRDLELALCDHLLARLHYGRGDRAEAEGLCRHAVSILSERQPGSQPDLVQSRGLLGTILIDAGILEEAQQELREALEMLLRLVDLDHPDVAALRYQQARLRYRQGSLREAEQLCRDALAIQQDQLAENHPALADSMTLLEMILADVPDERPDPG